MNLLFSESLDLKEHPIKSASQKRKTEYFSALSYIINTVARYTEDREFFYERLKIYQSELFSDVDTNESNQKTGLHAVRACVKMPWRKKYRFSLICDTALILFQETLITQAIEIINECLLNKNSAASDSILALPMSGADGEPVKKVYRIVSPLIKQYQANKLFLTQKERRIIVTANISAGKSTLINALIGKPLARTSQEVCTNNVCFFYNKAFEDDRVHLAAQTLTMNVDDNELYNFKWTNPISIASYFVHSTPSIPKLCIIDTPGVNAALYRQHAEITHTTLLNADYDMILYVVAPTNLGTDAETKYLQWASKNLPKEKFVFVLNKLDDYRDWSDSIEESIHSLREDLQKVGFENPVICPISAYFSYLLKLHMTGSILSDDESDEYAYLSKKFMRPSYDLSRYYNEAQPAESDVEEITLCKRAGIYGLEKIIYGG